MEVPRRCWITLLVVVVAALFAAPAQGRRARHAPWVSSGEAGPAVRCARCPPGWGVERRCVGGREGQYRDTACTPCRDAETFSPHHSARAACLLCSRCGPGLYVAKECTVTHDAVCAACHPPPPLHRRNEDYALRCSRHVPREDDDEYMLADAPAPAEAMAEAEAEARRDGHPAGGLGHRDEHHGGRQHHDAHPAAGLGHQASGHDGLGHHVDARPAAGLGHHDAHPAGLGHQASGHHGLGHHDDAHPAARLGHHDDARPAAGLGHQASGHHGLGHHDDAHPAAGLGHQASGHHGLGHHQAGGHHALASYGLSQSSLPARSKSDMARSILADPGAVEKTSLAAGASAARGRLPHVLLADEDDEDDDAVPEEYSLLQHQQAQAGPAYSVLTDEGPVLLAPAAATRQPPPPRAAAPPRPPPPRYVAAPVRISSPVAWGRPSAPSLNTRQTRLEMASGSSSGDLALPLRHHGDDEMNAEEVGRLML